ncbi:MAG: peptide chain release factor N(5)-glutamine methyltransferase, partial [Opitutales bacterium]
TEAQMQTAEPEVVENEPSDALVAGADGLGDLRQIISATPIYLKEGGMLALETGTEQHDALERLCADVGLTGQGIADMSGRPRFFLAQ